MAKNKDELYGGHPDAYEAAVEQMKNVRTLLKDRVKQQEKDRDDLVKMTATEEARLQGTKESKKVSLKPFTERVYVKDRRELGKLLTEAKAKGVIARVGRSVKEGYRYVVSLSEKLDSKITSTNKPAKARTDGGKEYRKIDIFVDGEYVYSTNAYPTVKAAIKALKDGGETVVASIPNKKLKLDGTEKITGRFVESNTTKRTVKESITPSKTIIVPADGAIELATYDDVKKWGAGTKWVINDKEEFDAFKAQGISYWLLDKDNNKTLLSMNAEGDVLNMLDAANNIIDPAKLDDSLKESIIVEDSGRIVFNPKPSFKAPEDGSEPIEEEVEDDTPAEDEDDTSSSDLFWNLRDEDGILTPEAKAALPQDENFVGNVYVDNTGQIVKHPGIPNAWAISSEQNKRNKEDNHLVSKQDMENLKAAVDGELIVFFYCANENVDWGNEYSVLTLNKKKTLEVFTEKDAGLKAELNYATQDAIGAYDAQGKYIEDEDKVIDMKKAKELLKAMEDDLDESLVEEQGNKNMTVKELMIEKKSFIVEAPVSKDVHLFIEGLSEDGESIGEDFDIKLVKKVLVEVIENKADVVDTLDATLNSKVDELVSKAKGLLGESLEESKERINTSIDDEGVLKIFLGNRLLAEITDGREDDEFIDDILFGLGYDWKEDGTVEKLNEGLGESKEPLNEMLIDLILDRKDGIEYDPENFYREAMTYNSIFKGIADEITRAMDEGTEEDVKKALCDYVIGHDYNPKICDYINSVQWLNEALKEKQGKAKMKNKRRSKRLKEDYSKEELAAGKPYLYAGNLIPRELVGSIKHIVMPKDPSDYKDSYIKDWDTEKTYKIGQRAFYDCSNLKSITIEPYITEIRAMAFNTDNNDLEIKIVHGGTNRELAVNEGLKDFVEKHIVSVSRRNRVITDAVQESKRLKEARSNTDIVTAVTANGDVVSAVSSTRSTRTYNYEDVTFKFKGKRGHGSYGWQNRPWQRFEFAEALKKAMVDAGIPEDFATECTEKISFGDLQQAIEYFAANWKEEGLKEDLKIVSDITTFEPWSGAVATLDKIKEAGKLEELEFFLEDIYPDGIERTSLNDLLWFEEEWLYDMLGMNTGRLLDVEDEEW